MDVLAVTDFPDIRFKAVVQSADEGNILVIPREGGYMVRLYIELDQLGVNERLASRTVTIERLIDAARRMLRAVHPGRRGGRLVVGLRDRAAPLRQVRRRAATMTPRSACRACSSPATPATPTAPRLGRA